MGGGPNTHPDSLPSLQTSMIVKLLLPGFWVCKPVGLIYLWPVHTKVSKRKRFLASYMSLGHCCGTSFLLSHGSLECNATNLHPRPTTITEKVKFCVGSSQFYEWNHKKRVCWYSPCCCVLWHILGTWSDPPLRCCETFGRCRSRHGINPHAAHALQDQ